MRDEFRVKKSSAGYGVELCRDGKPYVTFVDGLTRQSAEREARSLTALWVKISAPSSTGDNGEALMDRQRLGPEDKGRQLGPRPRLEDSPVCPSILSVVSTP